MLPQIKQMNRQSELLLHDAELLAALAFIVGDKNPGTFLLLLIFKLSAHEHEVWTIYAMHYKPENSISAFGYPLQPQVTLFFSRPCLAYRASVFLLTDFQYCGSHGVLIRRMI